MRFADFEIDERSGELRRAGERLRLQDLPFRLLAVLVRRAGDVVTRDELRAELWGTETFVDAEAGLNTAIAKIREALGDSADAPRFVETLPKRGYRFIGTIEPDRAAEPIPSTRTSASFDAPVQPARATDRRVLRLAVAALGIIVIAISAWYVSRPAPDITIAVVRFHNETGVAGNDRLAGTLTDAVVVSLAAETRYGVIGNSPLLRTERIFADANKIGRALKADYVLLGQLQEGDAGLLIRAHLIRTSDQKHVWAAPIALPASNKEGVLTTAIADGISRTVNLEPGTQK